eukprot:CAMPEP_0174235876 /NCGR_PEP_ID=MMETSP0417-20130205/5185_1 /TAXON_ID=242541 /ORGANISM="Mayorella sp, Strain BSH-02190019" /LENGTH=660 /DNA_ID=CAMNT_0015314441 /DNA_START=143 /DNA_END=2125 /DNA_ORIENTATION=-
MGEIVTLQFGLYANFVAAHYWNLLQAQRVHEQRAGGDVAPDTDASADLAHSRATRRAEDPPLNWNALMRMRDDDRYHPRVLVFDARGSVGSSALSVELRQSSADRKAGYSSSASGRSASSVSASSSSSSSSSCSVASQRPLAARVGEDFDVAKTVWQGTTLRTELGGGSFSSVTDAEPERSAGLVLDEESGLFSHQLADRVGVWSDFLETPYLPASLHELEDVHFGIDPFDLFTDGAAVWNRPNEREDIRDQVHVLVEECDSIAGFQCFLDMDGGHGSLAQKLLEELRDDFGSRPIFSVGVQKPSPSANHAANSALCFTEFAQPLCDVFLPLSAPHCMPSLRDYRSQNLYLTASLLASAVDLATHSYRISTRSLRSSAVDMRSFASTIAPLSGQCVVSSALALPFQLSDADLGALLSDRRSLHQIGADLGLVSLPMLPHSVLSSPLSSSSSSSTKPSYLSMVRPPLSQAVSLRGLDPEHVVRQAGVPLVGALKMNLLASGPRNLITCLSSQHRLPASYPSMFYPPSSTTTSSSTVSSSSSSSSCSSSSSSSSSSSLSTSSSMSSSAAAVAAQFATSDAFQLEKQQTAVSFPCTRESVTTLAYTYQSREMSVPLATVAKRWRESGPESRGDLLRSGCLETDDLDEVANTLGSLVEAYRGCT